MPVAIPAAGMAQMMAGIRAMAAEAGRDPSKLSMVVRANYAITEEPLGDDRWIFTGSPDQLRADIAATREIGASELFFDPLFSSAGTSGEGFLSAMEEIRELV